MIKKFTKSDLKNRMVVETRNGEKYILVDDRFLSKTGFLWLNTHTDKNRGTFHQGYNDDLTIDSGANWDIIKVYKEVNNLCFYNDDVYGALDLLWERKPVKEVTMAEVEEKFGCKVKIIND
jgi:hypothetical protein